MKHVSLLPLARLIVPAALALLPQVAKAQLSNYFPLNETSGTTFANSVAGGVTGSLFGNAVFVSDAQRGRVLQFNGGGSYGAAGEIPQITPTTNFTWSFWANTAEGASTNVILGNRTDANGADPLIFTKFTNNGFEFYVGNGNQNLSYPTALPTNSWTHLAAVKNGNMLFLYQNGLIVRSNYITAGMNAPKPLYLGGDRGGESWTGKLDDVATYTSALPTASVLGIAKGLYTPANAPLTAPPPSSLTTIFSDDFSGGLAKWNTTNRGLEQNGDAGYNAPVIDANQRLVLGGTATKNYWYGRSLESVSLFDAGKVTEVSVDRFSLSGTGSAYRSSLWILGDDGHYLHLSQNVGEGGWSFNARDDGGIGGNNPTGGGVNLLPLDAIDGNLASHNMKIRLEPTGDPGDINMMMYVDGTLVGAQGFSNFPSNFRVAITGQARDINDSVSATFDNVLVQQVPEPGSVTLLLAGAALLLRRRRQ